MTGIAAVGASLMARPIGFVALSWLVTCLWAPTSAYSSKATLGPPDPSSLTSVFDYQAAPGEANAFEMTASAANGVITIVATDPGAPITPGEGCAALGARSVRCESDTGARFFIAPIARITLGDASDSARLVFEPSDGFFPGAEISGGPGNDRLASPASAPFGSGLDGGPGNDLLIGGDADDGLDGGGGVDELHGGAGRNSLTDGDRSGSVDGDILDGGGDAVLIYRSRTKPLRVDLRDSRSAGERGEGDRVRGVTDVEGGRGNDILAGTGGANRLYGGGGADRLYGRGGNDGLALQDPGVAVGGAGDDAIGLARAGTAICGQGSDTVGWAGNAALGVGPWLSRSCERISLSEAGYFETELLIRPPRPIAVTPAARLVFRVPCLGANLCSQHLTITRPRPPFAVLGSRRFKTPEAGRRIAIEIPAEVVAAARRRPVRLRVRLDGVVYLDDERFSVAWRFDLSPRTKPHR